MQGAAKSVIRAVPVAVLRPAVGAADAVSRALLGARNELDPGRKMDAERKCVKVGEAQRRSCDLDAAPITPVQPITAHAS